MAAEEEGTISRAGLYLMGTRGLAANRLGPPTLVAKSTDGARIAVLRTDGTVAVYSTAGRLLLNVTPSAAKMITLHGRYLIVLTTTRKLEVYDSHTGSLLKTLPVRGRVKATPQNLDVETNIAVYTVWPEVRAVNLKSGKDRVIGHMRAFYFYDRVFAQIRARWRRVHRQCSQPPCQVSGDRHARLRAVRARSGSCLVREL